ncbi:conserved hypothetical protein [uncultured delta proteobacterium]|uniref:Tellurite resistance TerB family protein n=1 Tax=uncultured delta proteobacterium TaxID=34034 RepID=A0A212IVV3_9DELT|nr:conserved hypothetical protein [uncultured delta proteobacterium]
MNTFLNGSSSSILSSVKEQLQGAIGGNSGNNGGGLAGMAPGLLGAGALGGIAGALLSGKSMKKMATGALAVGGGVAAGALAWNLYKQWSSGRGDATPVAGQGIPAAVPPAPAIASSGALSGTPGGAEPDGMLFLEAMIFAARADGHIDAREQARINSMVEEMMPGQGAKEAVESFLNRPIDPRTLAGRVHSPQEAHAVYKLSCLMLDVDHFMERAYLDMLAQNLNIDQVTREMLELDADAARRAMDGGMPLDRELP